MWNSLQIWCCWNKQHVDAFKRKFDDNERLKAMEEYVSGGGELNLKQKASPGLKSETECLVSVLQVLHPDICWVKQKQHNFTAPGISTSLTIHYILKCGHCHDIGHVCRDIQHKSQVICVCVVNWEIKVGRFTRACELKLTPLDLEQLYGRPGRVLLNTSSKRHSTDTIAPECQDTVCAWVGFKPMYICLSRSLHSGIR